MCCGSVRRRNATQRNAAGVNEPLLATDRGEWGRKFSVTAETKLPTLGYFYFFIPQVVKISGVKNKGLKQISLVARDPDIYHLE